MTRITRRRFIQQSTLATVGATVALSGTKSSGQVGGANDRINIAVAGCGGRGGAHVSEWLKESNVHVAYLVDPDENQFGNKVGAIEKRANYKPKTVQDYRRAFEDKDVNAVSIATTNHWHAPLTIFACMAGKDVYVEKPASHNVREGRIALEMARKYKRIVQHGTQQRSSGRANEIAAVQSGKYGKLLVSKGYCCKRRNSIGFKEHEKPPAHIDWDIWVGPAPEQPFHRNLVHYNWHWFWDFGNGDIGNQGVHEIDVMRWAIKDATLPTRVVSLGGRLGYEDQGQTANTQMVVYTFGDVLGVFEVRGLIKGDPKFKFSRAKVANEFYTTEGMIAGGWLYPKNGGDRVRVEGKGTVHPGSNFGNFINCVRSRKQEELNADIEHGHYSSALCHLGNISYRTGETGTWGELPDRFGTNDVVKETFENLSENLKEHDVPLNGLKYTVGRVLNLDPQTERFTGAGSEEANKLLTRDYRAPYQIPKSVV